MAWLNGWAKRVKLTIDQNDIDDALSNFPILVHLSTSSGREPDDVSFVFDELENDANRKKIAITTSDGETQCYVEIEKWDDANEKAWLWVKVPSIASDADTDLYLYYDKTKADNDTYVGDTNSTPAENVWDANFKLVCHMRDDPDTSHVRDSTGNNNDGTKKGANEPIEVDGKIGKAQDLDGTNDYVALAQILDSNTFTFEAWAYLDTSSLSKGHPLFYQGTGLNDTGTVLGEYSGGFFFFVGGGGIVASGTSFPTGQWLYIVGQSDSLALKIFVDNVEKHSGAGNASPSENITSLGRWYAFTDHSRFYDGKICEIRFSNIIRPAAWIKASYESEIDHLLDFGSEEEAANINSENKSANIAVKMIAGKLI